MRTYEDIYKDYCSWLVEQTGDESYSYKNRLEGKDETVVKATLYKEILDRCYDKNAGLYYFSKFIVGDLMDIGYPQPFRFNSLLRKWEKLVKNNKKLAVLCARGHGKSVFFSQLLNIYDMFLFKFRRVLMFSASQEQANRILSDMKDIIDNNEWLKSKKEEGRWSVESIGYNKGYVKVKGVGGEIRGEHVDRIVLDDILTDDNKITDQQIEDFIDMTLSPMLLNRRGQMIIVGTPKSESDIFSTIKKRVREAERAGQQSPWVVAEFPAVLDFEKKILLCPDRFSWEEIMHKRMEMGPLKFAREYQLEFYSRDTSLFPPRLVTPAKEKGKEFTLHETADKRGANWNYVMGVDVARSGAVSADYTVAIVIAHNTVDQTKQVVHMWREKGLKISEQVRHISKIAKNFNNCMVFVEKNNMGQEMIDQLVDDHNTFVESFTTTNKSKDELIRFLINSFEHEQIVLPRGDRHSQSKMDILEEELSKFCVTTTPAGNQRFEGVGAHDDAVMAFALANKGTQEVGVPFAIRQPRDQSVHEYGEQYEAYIRTASDKESDLVNMMKMGILK